MQPEQVVVKLGVGSEFEGQAGIVLVKSEGEVRVKLDLHDEPVNFREADLQVLG